MESIDKLRELACDINGNEIVDHMQIYPSCVFDGAWLDAWHRAFDKELEALEREIEVSYMRLPVDADGVPIHMGDTVEGELVFDGATVKGTVTTYHIHDNDEPDTVYIKVGCGSDTWTIKELRIERCRHVKPRTLEDVLTEMLDRNTDGVGLREFNRDFGAFVAHYADEIRELLSKAGD